MAPEMAAKLPVSINERTDLPPHGIGTSAPFLPRFCAFLIVRKLFSSPAPLLYSLLNFRPKILKKKKSKNRKERKNFSRLFLLPIIHRKLSFTSTPSIFFPYFFLPFGKSEKKITQTRTHPFRVAFDANACRIHCCATELCRPRANNELGTGIFQDADGRRLRRRRRGIFWLLLCRIFWRLIVQSSLVPMPSNLLLLLLAIAAAV